MESAFRLPITDNFVFFRQLSRLRTIKQNMSKSAFSEGMGHF